MMDLYRNEDVAWLHVQDVQREAENRRLIAAERQSASTSVFRRLFGRRAGARTAGQSAEREQQLA